MVKITLISLDLNASLQQRKCKFLIEIAAAEISAIILNVYWRNVS